MIYFLLAINAFIYFLFVFGIFFSPRIANAVHSLAAYNGADAYTLVTYAFLHEDFSHLAFNCASLFIFGRLLSGLKISLAKWALIYLGGAAASAAGFLALNDATLLGASGAISALVGFFAQRARQFSLVAVFVALNLFGSFFASHIAFSAHICGLIYGFALAFVLPREK